MSNLNTNTSTLYARDNIVYNILNSDNVSNMDVKSLKSFMLDLVLKQVKDKYKHITLKSTKVERIIKKYNDRKIYTYKCTIGFVPYTKNHVRVNHSLYFLSDSDIQDMSRN